MPPLPILIFFYHLNKHNDTCSHGYPFKSLDRKTQNRLWGEVADSWQEFCHTVSMFPTTVLFVFRVVVVVLPEGACLLNYHFAWCLKTETEDSKFQRYLGQMKSVPPQGKWEDRGRKGDGRRKTAGQEHLSFSKCAQRNREGGNQFPQNFPCPVAPEVFVGTQGTHFEHKDNCRRPINYFISNKERAGNALLSRVHKGARRDTRTLKNNKSVNGKSNPISPSFQKMELTGMLEETMWHHGQLQMSLWLALMLG